MNEILLDLPNNFLKENKGLLVNIFLLKHTAASNLFYTFATYLEVLQTSKRMQR